MNEVPEQNEEIEEPPIYRYIVIVDGSPHTKSVTLEASVISAREADTVTDDPIGIYSLH